MLSAYEDLLKHFMIQAAKFDAIIRDGKMKINELQF
jgi:hypothetical protein